jgi:nucleotide-binding universal stress UspA family protein
MAPPHAWFREVVCAVDFTKVSVSALHVALMFTPRSGRITLVHALREVSAGLIFSGGEAARLTREYEDQVATVSQDLLRMVPAKMLRRCRVDRAVVSGLPHRRILDVASETEAGLIVMGLPRRGRLDEFLSGSISRAVLRGAKSPVLLVPAGIPAGHDWL